MSESVASLARLRRRLARLERAAPRDAARFATGCAAIDAWLGGGLNRARLHEIVAAADDDAAAAAGFGAMLACRAAGGAMLWLRCETAERRGGALYGAGLAEIGIAPGAVLVAMVADEAALLRAANDAARCAGVGALLVEIWGNPRALDLTATRRLMLAAEASGVTVLMLRIAADQAPSVADTRWRVAPAPSRPFADGSAAGAPGHPAFEIELLRRRAGPAGRAWRVEWNRDRQSFQDAAAEAIPRAVLPLAAG